MDFVDFGDKVVKGWNWLSYWTGVVILTCIITIAVFSVLVKSFRIEDPVAKNYRHFPGDAFNGSKK